MRIIHCILGKANPERMNGVNRVVNELATKQQQANKNVEVWGISKNIEHNYPERTFSTRLYKEAVLQFIVPRKLKKDILQLDASETIFHLHGGFIPLYPALVRTLRKKSIRYIITPHGAYNKLALNKNPFIKKIYTQLFEKTILRHAHYIHCLGKSETDIIKTFIAPEKIKVIPYGFEQPVNSDLETHQKNKSLVFGYCGRIDIHTKGLDLLMQGFANFLTQSKADAYLNIIGGGTELPRLTALASALGVADKVIFSGAKYGKEKFTLLQEMDVFFHPSRNEGLPTAVLEASMLGIPCVLSEETNMGEYIRKSGCGIMLERNDANTIQNTMALFHQQKQINALHKTHTEKIKKLAEFFNWKTIIPQFEKLYLG
ncbi:MAG: glycosyltransferase family 4 protein [Chitinophagales bacterium]